MTWHSLSIAPFTHSAPTYLKVFCAQRSRKSILAKHRVDHGLEMINCHLFLDHIEKIFQVTLPHPFKGFQDYLL
tara:strand:- start:796 stop:1017 length:222 start_codon:yes stop_codon:yes gene_type:complete